MRDEVEKLINQECKSFAPHDYLAYLGPAHEFRFEVRVGIG